MTILLAALLCSSLPLPGQLVDRASDLKITHQKTKGGIEVEYKGRTLPYKKGEPIRLRARDKEKVNLRVIDPNTLLFTYKLGERKEANTADHESIVKFVTETLAKIFPTPAAGAAAVGVRGQRSISERVTLNGVSIAQPEVLQHTEALLEQFLRISPAINASFKATTTGAATFDPGQAETAVAGVRNLLAFFEQLEFAMIPAQPAQSIHVERFHSVPRTEDLTPTNFLGQPDFQQLNSLFRLQRRLEKLVASVRTFIADYRAYQDALAKGVPVGEVVADNQKDITQEVVIGANAAYAEDKDVKAHQGDFTGTYSFVVSPVQSFHFRIGAGVIYSFVRNPEYTVATDAAGVITIAEKTSDYNAVAGAVALNIYPDRYFEEPMKPFVQLGASPNKDANALLAGIGFSAFEKFNLAAGLIYQQRRELGGGQSVGQTLAKAEDLSVKHKFKSGFYVQVGIAF